MAFTTSNQVCDNSTLANLQAWSSAIFNAIVTTCGWVQTADTGQAANPIGSIPVSTFVYWIFKANDAQAATLPIFVKVEIGFSSTLPRMRFTVGTGSNGTGTITGTIISNAPWSPDNGNLVNHGATTFPCFFSGDSGEFRMLMWATISPNNTSILFGIERSKDSSGNKTTDYFTVFSLTTCSNPSATIGGQQTITSGLALTPHRLLPASVILDGVELTGSFGGTVAPFPIFPVVGKCGNPMLGFMTAYVGDAAMGTVVSVASDYGATHNYVVLANTGNNAINNWINGQGSGTAGASVLMRYE